jgi:class 3 adenylate cyclase
VTCPSCGHENPAGARFCNGCGGPLQAAAIAERVADPRLHPPKYLAEKILTSRSALEGERKQVTVLFADLKGSMDLGEKVDPEEWYRIMDRFFQILAGGVHHFEGTVNEYRGDGIEAIFGALVAHEDHARRACYAALKILHDSNRGTRERNRHEAAVSNGQGGETAGASRRRCQCPRYLGRSRRRGGNAQNVA